MIVEGRCSRDPARRDATRRDARRSLDGALGRVAF
jgi:hypothetical protein